MDFGKGKGWQHLAIVTGWGQYINYVDPISAVNFASAHVGKGDKIAQHTTDRDGAPWNIGIYMERDPKIPAKWTARVVHFRNSGKLLFLTPVI